MRGQYVRHTMTSPAGKAFTFGKNWVEYVQHFVDDDRIEQARASLLHYLPEDEFRNKVFIDIGCGSGIFSLNALRLGCRQVISFDIDPDSVKAATLVREKYSRLVPRDGQWAIFQGDILDSKMTQRFQQQGDIVYSWGVLHHTGRMWEAIGAAARLVKPGGFFIIAIYNRAPSSDFWCAVKRWYARRTKTTQVLLTSAVLLYLTGRNLGGYAKSFLLGRPKPLPHLESRRGMTPFTSVMDWLGGYPYESASFEEITRFVEDLGFGLTKSPTRLPSPPKTFFNRISFEHTNNNEFVFQKHGSV